MRKRLCPPNSENTYFWPTLGRAAQTPGFCIQGNGQLKSAQNLSPPLPTYHTHMTLLLPVQNQAWIIKSQHTEWQEMIVLWPWEPLVWNDKLHLVAWSQLFFTARNHNILLSKCANKNELKNRNDDKKWGSLNVKTCWERKTGFWQLVIISEC